MSPITLTEREVKLLAAVLDTNEENIHITNTVLAQKAGVADPAAANKAWDALRAKISSSAADAAGKTTTPAPKTSVVSTSYDGIKDGGFTSTTTMRFAIQK